MWSRGIASRYFIMLWPEIYKQIFWVKNSDFYSSGKSDRVQVHMNAKKTDLYCHCNEVTKYNAKPEVTSVSACSDQGNFAKNAKPNAKPIKIQFILHNLGRRIIEIIWRGHNQ